MDPTPKERKRIYLITHLNCLDGSGCAICFLHAGGKQEDIRYVPAGKVDRLLDDEPDFGADGLLIIADVAPGKEWAERLEKRGNVVVLDHHKTSEFLSKKNWCTIDQTLCGSQLMLNFLRGAGYSRQGPSLEEMTCIIADRDLWKNEMPISQQFSVIHAFYGQRRFVDDRSFHASVSNCWTLNKFDQELSKLLIENRKENSRKIAEHTVTKMISVGQQLLTFGYVFADGDCSDVLHEVLSTRPLVDVAVAISADAGTVSLRSRPGGPDVAVIAKSFGGGGHSRASGHRIPRDIIEDFIGQIHS